MPERKKSTKTKEELTLSNEGAQNGLENPQISFDTVLLEKEAKKPAVIKRSRSLKQLLSEPKVEFAAPDFGGAPATWREHIEALRDHQSRIRRSEKAQDFAKVNINSNLPVGIVLTSDWHMGGKGTDYETWLRHMELVRNEPQAFMIPLSNTIDNFIFPSGMFDQMEHPSLQQEIVKNFAKEFQGKFLAIVGSRCHEGWTKQKTDVEVNLLMFEDVLQRGVPWMPTGGVLELTLNSDVKYTFGLIHKSRNNSSLNKTNANRRMREQRWPVDITAIAHHHVKEISHGNQYEGPFEREVLDIRTGAYKIKDAYGEGEGFGQGDIGSPMVVIFPGEKKFIPFYSLEDGIRYLQLEKAFAEFSALKNGVATGSS